jgi:hypothetical protein
MEDVAGKVVKSGFKRRELEDNRATNAFDCYTTATESFPNSDLPRLFEWKTEANEKLLQ